MRLILAFFLTVLLLFAGGPGFRSQRSLNDHFKKHGAEFGNISKADYLQMAQELRDAPVSEIILEAKRADGVVTKFDRKQKYFGAYNSDRTIRTFFVPNDGERYFNRQARRK